MEWKNKIFLGECRGGGGGGGVKKRKDNYRSNYHKLKSLHWHRHESIYN